MRGETEADGAKGLRHRDFNPLPSCEGRQRTCENVFDNLYFNPLPSCEGRPYRWRNPTCQTLFQSTPLMRGETVLPVVAEQQRDISIHSPHARGDVPVPLCHAGGLHFNPLPSCEGRRRILVVADSSSSFQSTPLMRGETLFSLLPYLRIAYFNPLPSCEGRLNDGSRIENLMLFQSTPLMRGETAGGTGWVFGVLISIHSPHARGDAAGVRKEQKMSIFQSTPLMRGETA